MGKKLTEAKREAIKRYDAENTKQIHLKLNRNTDAEVIRWLEDKENIQGYIKELIREDMLHGEAKDYGSVYDYMREDFQDGKADVFDRICQSLMKCGVLIIARTEHPDRVRFKWILRGKEQKDMK